MSLQINAQGTRDGILKHLDEQQEKLPPGTDKAQAEAVKALVVSEVKALPEGTNGVRLQVEASAHKGGRTVMVSLLPMQVHV